MRKLLSTNWDIKMTIVVMIGVIYPEIGCLNDRNECWFSLRRKKKKYIGFRTVQKPIPLIHEVIEICSRDPRHWRCVWLYSYVPNDLYICCDCIVCGNKTTRNIYDAILDPKQHFSYTNRIGDVILLQMIISFSLGANWLSRSAVIHLYRTRAWADSSSTARS